MIAPKKIKISNTHPIYGGGKQGTFYTCRMKKDMSNVHVYEDGDSCREIFAEVFKTRTKFIAFNSKTDISKLNSFFNIVEKYTKEKITFFRTNERNIYILELPGFWTKNEVSRSLFTLLLRAATYFENSFDAALSAYDLSSSVKPAIYYFLNGHTKPLFHNYDCFDSLSGGFVSEFEGLEENRLKHLLVKP